MRETSIFQKIEHIQIQKKRREREREKVFLVILNKQYEKMCKNTFYIRIQSIANL